jgi:hypothetical protein
MGDEDEDVNESKGAVVVVWRAAKKKESEKVFHSWHQMDSTLVAFCCLFLLFAALKNWGSFVSNDRGLVWAEQALGTSLIASLALRRA